MRDTFRETMNATGLGEVSSVRRAYRQLIELGRGGMARVYLAESLASGVRKLVVLKVLNPEFCASPEMRMAFRREAELSGQMNHPNVVQVMEVVDQADTAVIVMEYLDGVPLNVLLKKAGKHLPLPLLMYILSQVLVGLHHFHELKDLDGAPLHAVHRDVSPHNVMVLHDGPVKVLDFGIAKIHSPDTQVTRTGLIKGKIHYMPPEQLLGEAGIDRRADIFAVGVILWEAVAGRRMWEGKGETEMLRSIVNGTLPALRDFAPEAPEAVLQIVQRATEIDRDQRFPTALAMQSAIEAALAEQGWPVQGRDLAEFMSQHFGDMRRARETEIRNALRNPSGSHVIMAVNPAAYATSEPPPSRETERGVSRSSTASLAPSLTARRKWGWALAALLVSAAVGLYLTQSGDPAASSTPQLANVTLEVEVVPRGAEIFLDGKGIGRDRFVGQLPWSERRMSLEVRAPGHKTERKEIALRRDTALHIVLEPIPSAVAPAPLGLSSGERSVSGSSPAPWSAPGSSSSTTVSAAVPSPVVPSSSTRKTKRALTSAHCKPPYTFGADGVKTYKPECF